MEVSNIPPIPEEPQMPPLSMLDSRVHFYYAVGYPSDPWHEYGKTMEERYQKFVVSTPSLARIAAEIAPQTMDAESRLRRLYARVQQLRYISFEPSKTEKEIKRENLPENRNAEEILRHGYGSGNEANFLFAALARAANFDASIVEVTDRRKAIFDPNVPDSRQLDALIVMVRLDGKKLFFDPATRFCPYGQLPWFESDTEGVAWGRFGGYVILVPGQDSDVSLVERTAELTLQEDGTLQGDIEVIFKGQEALDRRLDGVGEDEAGRRKLLEDEIKSWLPAATDLQVNSMSGWESSDDSLRIKCRLKIPSYAIVTNQRVLFDAGVFQSQRKVALRFHGRTQPVYYDRAHEQADKVAVEIPPKYQFEALPGVFKSNTKFAACQIKHSIEGGKVTRERHEQLNGYYFKTDSYEALWSYLAKVRQSDGENVVLRLKGN
jgi:hypothetical protein